MSFAPFNAREAWTLVCAVRRVFSIRAKWPARPRLEDTEGDVIGCRGGGSSAAVRRRRGADVSGEGACERADAGEADREADLRDAVVRRPQQIPGPLQPAAEQVLVRGLAEDPPKAAAEVPRRDVGGARERPEVEALGVAAVDQIPGPEQVAFEQRGLHGGNDASLV